MSEEKRNDDQEMSMEEILASIRRYVADDTPETNNQEGGVDYTTGKTADVIRLTEALDSNDSTITTEQQTVKKDLNAASLQPKEIETEKKISSPPPQKNEQNYAYNPKVKPFVAPAKQEPAERRQHFESQNQPIQQQRPSPQQPVQQQYTSQQYHDPLQTYGEQIAQPRTYQQHHMHEHYPQSQHPNHHYGQNSMDYSRQSQQHQPNAPTRHLKPSILSEPTIHSTESAFSKLTQAFQFAHNEKKQAEEQSAVYGTSAIESFVIEMARPMIREWVDQHLPKLVDKLVTQEIEKLTEDLRKKLL
ncbi:MAG: hypothetical protein COY39_01885 [Alphaproteobacteria bacterium CG_4_10_14_0_8_um_filter_37_21]|nr:MAG: hypothetical protein COY39_01885 [Alphaproteobacteria bacterium CG_4_10_14_0_8_um_filter_37_21]